MMFPNPRPLAAAAMLAFGLTGGPAFATCEIPTAANDWGTTCTEGTSPFNQRDFAAQCFWDHDCDFGSDDTQCVDELEQCIIDSAKSMFGEN